MYNIKREYPKENIIEVHLAYLIGNSYTYDYIYESQLDDYISDQRYKVIDFHTLKKDELIDKSIIDIADGNQRKD